MSGGTTGPGAVPLGSPATLRTLSDGHGLAAPVADLPQFYGGPAVADDGVVPVAPVGAAGVSEVVQFQDGNPSAGRRVAMEGHVTNGGTNRYNRQGSATPESAEAGTP